MDPIKKLLQNPKQYKFSEEKRRELIARLYKIEEEKKSVVHFVPFGMKPAFAGALATALLIFGYAHFFMPLYPVVFGVKGTVDIYNSREKSWVPAEKPEVRLRKGDMVRTSEGAEAEIGIPGLYHMRLKKNSEITLTRTRSRALADGIKYNLSKGRVFAYYRKGKGLKKKFEIETPEALLSALGTSFMVDRAPEKNNTWVGVLDGAVRAQGEKAAPVLVKAGEKTMVERGAVPLRPARLLKDELLALEELYQIGEKPQVALLLSTGEARVRELLSFTPLYISAKEDSGLPAEIREAARTFEAAMKTGSREGHVATIRKFEGIVRKYPNPKHDVQFLLFIGAYYEYLDEHEKALDTFKRIVDGYPKSDFSSLAECAIGIIYEEELTLSHRARTAYTKVLANYPQSPEAPEAKSAFRRLR